MPYCPNCKRDFDEGVTVCAFCDEFLVDELPESEDETAPITDAVVVYTTFSPFEAESIKARLKDCGITCCVEASECSSSVVPNIRSAYHDTAVKFDISVGKDDAAAAADIIEKDFGDGVVNYIGENSPIVNTFRISAFADEASPDLDMQIAALKNAGLSYIDLRGVFGKSCVDLTDEEVSAVKRKLDEAGIRVSCLASPIGKIGIKDDFETELARFKRGIDIAKQLDTKFIRIFSFFMQEKEKRRFRKDVMKKIGALLDAAENSGITVLHENEKGIYGSSAACCLDIHKTFSDRDFGMIFDPANFIQCDEVPIDAWDDLKKYVKYIHVKDAYFDTGDVVPAGYGDGCVADILRDAATLGDIFLSVEPHLSVSPWMEEIIDKEKFPRGDGNDAPALFDVACRALSDVLSGKTGICADGEIAD